MTYSQKNPIAFNEKPASSVKMNEEFVQIYGALNEIDGALNEIDGLKAPLESPALTGSPTAPTQPASDDSTKIATTAHVKSVVEDYAPLASPALTGSPTAPTQPASDDSTKIATTAYVKDQVASDTVAGMVELATSAEVLAGEDDKRAVTPKGLSDWNKTPVGTIITYPVSSIPTHCLECNGATISRETYSELFAAIGTTYGTGDGSTTFNLPDLRGEFIRGFDNGRGVDAGRALGSAQLDAMQKISGRAVDIYGGANPVVTGAFAESGKEVVGAFTPGAGMTRSVWFLVLDSSLVTRTAAETRPRNVAMMFCIVYE